MLAERVTVGELETNCWLASDGEGGPLVVIDPGGEPEVLLAAIGGRAVAAIVLTHGHFDHMGAAAALAEQTGAEVAVHEAEAGRLDDPVANLSAVFGFGVQTPVATRLLAEGDRIEAGALRLEVIHTPGHSPGGMSLYEPAPPDGSDSPHLFAGDAVFARSVGRTDIPGGDPRVLMSSVARLATLPPDTIVHPGHGPDTTIATEAMLNPFFPRA